MDDFFNEYIESLETYKWVGVKDLSEQFKVSERTIFQWLKDGKLESIKWKKKTFLKEYIKRIDVEYEPKIQSHKIDIEFKYPIIGDKMKFIGKKSDGRKDYIVSEGETTMNLIVPTSKQRKRMDDSDREKLNRKILELKLGEELSLNEICKELNRLKILTPTNKEWDKSKLSSYYKTLKSDVGK